MLQLRQGFGRLDPAVTRIAASLRFSIRGSLRNPPVTAGAFLAALPALAPSLRTRAGRGGVFSAARVAVFRLELPAAPMAKKEKAPQHQPAAPRPRLPGPGRNTKTPGGEAPRAQRHAPLCARRLRALVAASSIVVGVCFAFGGMAVEAPTSRSARHHDPETRAAKYKRYPALARGTALRDADPASPARRPAWKLVPADERGATTSSPLIFNPVQRACVVEDPGRGTNLGARAR